MLSPRIASNLAKVAKVAKGSSKGLRSGIARGYTHSFDHQIGETVVGSQYSKSVFTQRAPASAYQDLNTMGRAGFAAGRVAGDVMGSGTRAIAEFNMSNIYDLMASYGYKEARKLAPNAPTWVAATAPIVAGAGVYQAGTGRLFGQRPWQEQALEPKKEASFEEFRQFTQNPSHPAYDPPFLSMPVEEQQKIYDSLNRTAKYSKDQEEKDAARSALGIEDPRIPKNPIGERVQRGLFQQQGSLLPFDEFRKERPGVTYEQYQKYRNALSAGRGDIGLVGGDGYAGFNVGLRSKLIFDSPVSGVPEIQVGGNAIPLPVAGAAIAASVAVVPRALRYLYRNAPPTQNPTPPPTAAPPRTPKPPTQATPRPATAPPPRTPKAAPAPAASNTAYDQAFQYVKSKNLRSTQEIMDAISHAPGLPQDDLARQQIAQQFQQRLSSNPPTVAAKPAKTPKPQPATGDRVAAQVARNAQKRIDQESARRAYDSVVSYAFKSQVTNPDQLAQALEYAPNIPKDASARAQIAQLAIADAQRDLQRIQSSEYGMIEDATLRKKNIPYRYKIPKPSAATPPAPTQPVAIQQSLLRTQQDFTPVGLRQRPGTKGRSRRAMGLQMAKNTPDPGLPNTNDPAFVQQQLNAAKQRGDSKAIAAWEAEAKRLRMGSLDAAIWRQGQSQTSLFGATEYSSDMPLFSQADQAISDAAFNEADQALSGAARSQQPKTPKPLPPEIADLIRESDALNTSSSQASAEAMQALDDFDANMRGVRQDLADMDAAIRGLSEDGLRQEAERVKNTRAKVRDVIASAPEGTDIKAIMQGLNQKEAAYLRPALQQMIDAGATPDEVKQSLRQAGVHLAAEDIPTTSSIPQSPKPPKTANKRIAPTSTVIEVDPLAPRQAPRTAKEWGAYMARAQNLDLQTTSGGFQTPANIVDLRTGRGYSYPNQREAIAALESGYRQKARETQAPRTATPRARALPTPQQIRTAPIPKQDRVKQLAQSAYQVLTRQYQPTQPTVKPPIRLPMDNRKIDLGFQLGRPAKPVQPPTPPRPGIQIGSPEYRALKEAEYNLPMRGRSAYLNPAQMRGEVDPRIIPGWESEQTLIKRTRGLRIDDSRWDQTLLREIRDVQRQADGVALSRTYPAIDSNPVRPVKRLPALPPPQVAQLDRIFQRPGPLVPASPRTVAAPAARTPAAVRLSTPSPSRALTVPRTPAPDFSESINSESINVRHGRVAQPTRAPLPKPTGLKIPKGLGKGLGIAGEVAGTLIGPALEYRVATDEGASNNRAIARAGVELAKNLATTGTDLAGSIRDPLQAAQRGAGNLLIAAGTLTNNPMIRSWGEMQRKQSESAPWSRLGNRIDEINPDRVVTQVKDQFVPKAAQSSNLRAPSNIGATLAAFSEVARRPNPAKAQRDAHVAQLKREDSQKQAQRQRTLTQAIARQQEQRSRGVATGVDMLASGLLKNIGGAEGLRRLNRGQPAFATQAERIQNALNKSPWTKPGARINQMTDSEVERGQPQPPQSKFVKPSTFKGRPIDEQIEIDNNRNQGRAEISAARNQTTQRGQDIGLTRTRETNQTRTRIANQSDATKRRGQDVTARGQDIRLRGIQETNQSRERIATRRDTTTRRGQDTRLTGTKYTADRRLQGTVYTADQRLRGTLGSASIKANASVKVAERRLQGVVYNADSRLAGDDLKSSRKLQGDMYSADQRLRAAESQAEAKRYAATMKTTETAIAEGSKMSNSLARIYSRR